MKKTQKCQTIAEGQFLEESLVCGINELPWCLHWHWELMTPCSLQDWLIFRIILGNGNCSEVI